jgi:hypothetical protein
LVFVGVTVDFSFARGQKPIASGCTYQRSSAQISGKKLVFLSVAALSRYEDSTMQSWLI